MHFLAILCNEGKMLEMNPKNIILLNGVIHYLVMKSFMSPGGAELLDKLLVMGTSILPQILIVKLNSASAWTNPFQLVKAITSMTLE